MAALEPTGERTLPGIPAENYWFRRHEAAYRWAARRVRGRILDAGCGEGYGTALLSRGGARVLGIEYDQTTASHAAEAYPSPVVRGDLCRLPVAAGSLDAVVATQVLEHLYCPDAFVAACREALRPEGVLIVSTPNRVTFPAGNPSHVYEYEADELRSLLAAHLEEATVLGVHHRFPFSVMGTAFQSRILERPFEDQSRRTRIIVRTVRAWIFRVGPEPEGALDLVGIARR